MINTKKILVYAHKEKKSPFHFSEENFSRPPLRNYDISNHLLEKKRIESSFLNNKSFLELFSYDKNSLWWMVDWFYFWNPFTNIIYFIDQFKKILEDTHVEIVFVEDFKNFDIIKQICYEKNIKLNYSKKNLFFYQIKFKLTNFLRYKIRKYRLKFKLKKIIMINKQQFHKKNITIDIDKKILFAISDTYRKQIYDFETQKFQKGEHLIEPIIKIIKEEYDVCGMSLTHISNFSKTILEERLQTEIPWFSEEMILLKKTKNHKIFLKNYSRLISNKNFQNLFNYKNIRIWNHLEFFFNQMSYEPYFPYWLRMIDSLNEFFNTQKPKIIFLPSETDPVQRCIISSAQNFGIKTIGIQHGEGTKDAEHSESNFQTQSNPYGCPFPDKMLLFGNFTKREYVHKGYSESKFVEFCHPNYLNLEQILSISKIEIKKKFMIDNDKKIILFTTSRYTDKNYNYDILVLKKLIDEFKNNTKIFFLIKPHPSEKFETYSIFLDSDIKNFKVVQGNIIELIMLSDALISNTSTATIDAIALKKPVLEVKWQNSIDHYEASNIVFFSDIGYLRENISKILNDDYLDENMLCKYNDYIKDHYNIPVNKKHLSKILTQLITSENFP